MKRGRVDDNDTKENGEGYCRRPPKEYLHYLNFGLGSCDEFHSCYVRFKQAGQITDQEDEQLDLLHYKVENELLKLIESLQKSKRIRAGKIPLNPNNLKAPVFQLIEKIPLNASPRGSKSMEVGRF